MKDQPKTKKAKPQAAKPGNRVAAKAAPAAAKATKRKHSIRAPGLHEILRERIARQEVPPGAKLREQDVALEFNVPRTLVREVFSALEQRGLIERIPNRGAVVARFDLSQLSHIYDVREVLEGLCVRLASQNVPPESWQDLVELFDGPMQQYVANNDFDAFLGGYDQFRRRVVEAAENPVLIQMLDSIWDKAQVLIRRIIILPGRAQIGLQEHCAVLHAMRNGDGAAAENLRRANMRSAKEFFIRYRNYLL
jgi:DNA-binding GntR family transcriptional regulator